MKRIKSIDTIRGWCIAMMIFGHMLSWWVRPEDYWLTSFIHGVIGDIAAGGFLFVSGFSAVISLRSRLTKAENSDLINKNQVKNEYLFRALLILIVSLIYNSATAIGTLDPSNIWKWFIPLTIAMSLLIGYPLLKTSKSFRLIIAVIIWVAHYYILSFFLPYQGQVNVFGILFYILYNGVGLHPILNYISFFIIGTVIGDVMFEIFLRNDQKERRKELKNRFWFPLLIMGPILILIGVFFSFPNFLKHGTFSAMIYVTGVLLTSFSILFAFEEFKVFKAEKNYRFFYFYSFYSLTIYFSHNIIYFIFLKQLNTFTIWIAVIGTFTLLTLLIRVVYKKYHTKFSLKVQIAKLSSGILKKIEVKKNKIKPIVVNN